MSFLPTPSKFPASSPTSNPKTPNKSTRAGSFPPFSSEVWNQPGAAGGHCSGVDRPGPGPPAAQCRRGRPAPRGPIVGFSSAASWVCNWQQQPEKEPIWKDRDCDISPFQPGLSAPGKHRDEVRLLARICKPQGSFLVIARHIVYFTLEKEILYQAISKLNVVLIQRRHNFFFLN